MADTSLAFDIFARDHGAARAFRRVSDDMEGLRDSTGRLRRDSAQLSRATDELSRSETSMGLAARQAGLKVEEAMNRAAAARRRADQAAERLARGEISEAEAARLTERAERDLEKATLAAALASQAAAKAADQHAEQLRQVARDAALAGAAEQLALLRASGDRRAHNALLAATRRQFGDLDGDSNRTFRDMESFGRRAFGLIQRSGTSATGAVSKGFTSLGEMGPAAIVPIAVGIAALPALAVAAGGAVTLALGGGLAAVGIMAAAKNTQVKASFTDLKAHVGRELTTMAKPFEPVLVRIAGLAQSTFDKLAPSLKGALAQAAPAISDFADSFAAGMERFGPTIAMIGDEFRPLMKELGDRMPAILGHVADGIESIVMAAAGHEADIAGFAENLSKVVSVAGDVAEGLSHVYDVAKNFASFPDDPWSFIKDALPPLNAAVGLWNTLSGALTGNKNVLSGVFQETLTTGTGVQGLGQKAMTAAQQVTALDNALNKFLNPSLAVYNATTQLRDGQVALAEALKKSHGALDGHSAASRAARTAFAGQLSTVAQLGSATQKLTGDQNKTKMAVLQSLPGLYQAAGANRSAKAQVDALARSFGINARDAKSAKAEIGRLRAEIAGLRGKTITVTTKVHHISVSTREKIQGVATGGYIGPGYRAGGAIRGYANAGLVTGPGTGTSDDIPIMASNGEYMMRAASVAKNRAALDAANWHGAQLAVVKKKAWSKTTYSPWGTASIKPPAAPKPVGQSASVPGMPYWWRGQADTSFGPGRAHFAWGSARPDMAASVTAVTPKAVKPKSPWGNAQVGWGKESAKPAQLVIRSDGSKRADFVVAELRAAIQQGGGDVQKFLGVSS